MFFRNPLNHLIVIAFFGYAGFVNLLVLTKSYHSNQTFSAAVGSLSESLDTPYSEAQPHRTFAQGIIGALRYRVLREGRDGVVVGPENWLFTSEEFRAPLGDPDRSALIDEIINLSTAVQSAGDMPLFLLVPQKVDVVLERPSNAPTQLRERLMSKGVPVFEARWALEQSAQAFFRTDTHWTPDAAHQVAQELATVFPSLRGGEVYVRTDEGLSHFVGDLVPFITSKTFANWVGFDIEMAPAFKATISQKGNLDLFATDQTPAHVLVGTSYSADQRWGFANSLKLALSHDVLNFALEGQGPLDPMRAYLNDRAPDAPPRYVIWEFPERYLSDPELLAGEDRS